MIRDAAPVLVVLWLSSISTDPTDREEAQRLLSAASRDCAKKATGGCEEIPVSTIVANATRSCAIHPTSAVAPERCHCPAAKTTSVSSPHKRGGPEIELTMASLGNHSAHR